MISERAAKLGWLRPRAWWLGMLEEFRGADGAAPSRVGGRGVVKCNDIGIKTGKLQKYLYRCISLNLKSRDY